MKKYFIFFVAFLFAFGISCQKTKVYDNLFFTNDSDVLTSSEEIIPNKFIVVLKQDQLKTKLTSASNVERMRICSDVIASMENELFSTTLSHDFIYANSINGFSATLTAEQAQKLANHPMVDFIEPDKIIQLSALSSKSSRANNSSSFNFGKNQLTPWGVTRVNGGTSNTDNVAWILDTGIDFNHSDLNVDKTRSKSFLAKVKSASDQHGHGTFVAGIVGAKDNGIGVVGVAANATVVSVRVLDRQARGIVSEIIAGVDYVEANENTGDVANLSLGGGSYALNAAIINACAKCSFVIAACNSATNAANYFPANTNGPNIYTASAFDINDDFATFSNYGNPLIDYSQPGVDITSCWNHGKYTTMSGTSASAPHLAGLLLLGPLQNGGTVNNDRDAVDDIIAAQLIQQYFLDNFTSILYNEKTILYNFLCHYFCWKFIRAKQCKLRYLVSI